MLCSQSGGCFGQFDVLNQFRMNIEFEQGHEPVQGAGQRPVAVQGQLVGEQLDQGHIREFIAAVGVGLTSQYLEQFGRKLFGGLLGGLGGSLGRGVGRQAASSAMTFATTYAIGRVAQRYYAAGRTIDAATLKQTFLSMLNEAKGLAPGQGVICQVTGGTEPGKAVPVSLRLLFKGRYGIVLSAEDENTRRHCACVAALVALVQAQSKGEA